MDNLPVDLRQATSLSEFKIELSRHNFKQKLSVILKQNF